MWTGSHLRVLSYEAAENKQGKAIAVQKDKNEKTAATVGKNVEQGKQKYETVVKKIYVPVGCTYDNDGVQRIEQRLNEGKSFRKSASTLP